MNNQTSTTTNSQMQLRTEDLQTLQELANTLIEAQNTKPSLKTKLTSRKFWMAAAGCVAGVCGMIGCSESVTHVIAFVILEIVSIVAYCISEGSVDMVHKQQLAEAMSTLVGMIAEMITANELSMAQVATVAAQADAVPIFEDDATPVIVAPEPEEDPMDELAEAVVESSIPKE